MVDVGQPWLGHGRDSEGGADEGSGDTEMIPRWSHSRSTPAPQGNRCNPPVNAAPGHIVKHKAGRHVSRIQKPSVAQIAGASKSWWGWGIGDLEKQSVR